MLVDYGREPGRGKWICPARECWGLGPHQKMTPELEDRVCLTATLTGSYGAAAMLCTRWGCAMEASTIRAHACNVGRRAAAQEQGRLREGKKVGPRLRGAKVAASTALVIMMDGWLVRQRGEHWGERSTGPLAGRIAWHEVKGAVIYRLEQAGSTAGGRGLIARKYVVAGQEEPLEFGRRVQAQALRRGLAEAKAVYVVADGSVWIWKVQQDRFSLAQGVLDFYHASQHLWMVAHALYPEDESGARGWVEPLLSQLRHGQEQGVLQVLEDLPAWCVERGRTAPPEVARERDYFQSHREHIHYERMAIQGCPIGSGAMESFCSQLQGRFKRCGQFWSANGLADLLALEVARRNLDWDALWRQN